MTCPESYCQRTATPSLGNEHICSLQCHRCGSEGSRVRQDVLANTQAQFPLRCSCSWQKPILQQFIFGTKSRTAWGRSLLIIYLLLWILTSVWSQQVHPGAIASLNPWSSGPCWHGGGWARLLGSLNPEQAESSRTYRSRPSTPPLPLLLPAQGLPRAPSRPHPRSGASHPFTLMLWISAPPPSWAPLY